MLKAVEGLVEVNSMSPRSTTAVGRGGSVALEAYVGVGVTPEVFTGFFLGWPLARVGCVSGGVPLGLQPLGLGCSLFLTVQ
jgi:hypothetical protein